MQPESLLPTRNVTLWGDLRIGLDRLVLIGIALACAAVLRLVYTRTLFGLATSAVAENRRVAASAGWSPNRIELVNFAVAGGLSALAAILLAPIVTLNAAVLSVAVLPALAAALVGRFSSFGITVGCGPGDRRRAERDPAVPARHRRVAGRHRGVAHGARAGRAVGDHPRLHGRDGTFAPPAGRGRRPVAAARLGTGVAAPARRRNRARRRPPRRRRHLDRRPHHHVRPGHHRRVGHRGRRLRRAALAVPVRPRRGRGLGGGSAHVGQRLAVRGRAASPRSRAPRSSGS